MSDLGCPETLAEYIDRHRLAFTRGELCHITNGSRSPIAICLWDELVGVNPIHSLKEKNGGDHPAVSSRVDSGPELIFPASCVPPVIDCYHNNDMIGRYQDTRRLI